MRKKRVYNSEARNAKAVKTRSQILEVAKSLFQTKGFDQVTIQMIAKAAKVSGPTIYAVFKSKRGVLQGLIDNALPPKEWETLVEDSMKETAPEKCLKITAKLTRKMYDAERDFIDFLRGAFVLAPELKELELQREKRRYARQEEYVKKLMQTKSLAKTLTLQTARDILWAFTGRDLYRMLVMERAWTSERYEKWLAELLIKSLLPPTM